jgi:hypothetical protein
MIILFWRIHMLKIDFLIVNIVIKENELELIFSQNTLCYIEFLCYLKSELYG